MAKTSWAFLFLSSSLMSALGDPVSFPSPPDTGLSCFSSDKAYNGPVSMIHTTGCSRLCQKKCEIDPRCLFWTYTADSLGGNDCMLHTEAGKLVPSIGKISGPKRCLEPYHCVQKDFEVSGTAPTTTSKVDSHSCRRECAQHRTCGFANYSSRTHDRGSCYIKPSGGMNSNESFHSPGINAVPRDCSPGWCYSYGSFKECSGPNQIQVLNNIPDARKCQESCRLNEHCYLWSWNKGGDRRCYLYKRECANNPRVNDAKAVTGLKRCGSGSVCHENYDYAGGDITAVVAKNAEECNDFCFKEHRCHYFSYCPSDKLCWLKTEDSLLRRTPHNDRISGPAVCGNTPSCAETNRKPTGTDLAHWRNVKSEEDCADRCKRTAGCSVFTWNLSTDCWLKTDVTGALLTTNNIESMRSITSTPQCYLNLNF